MEVDSAPNNEAAAPAAPVSDAPLPLAAPDTLVLGIDLGTQKSVVAAARCATDCSPMPFIASNNLSNQATPSVLSLPAGNSARLVGEEALSTLVMRPAECVSLLRCVLSTIPPTTAGVCGGDLAVPVSVADGDPLVRLSVGNRQWASVQLAATLLGRLVGFAVQGARQRDEKARPVPAPRGAVLTAPTTSPPDVGMERALRCAAAIVELPVLAVITDIEAAMVQLSLTFCARAAAATSGRVRALIVDVGAGFAQAGVCEFSATSASLIAQAGTRDACSYQFDKILASSLSKSWAAKHGGQELVDLGAKTRARLLKQAEKTKQVLSTIAETTAAVSHLDDEMMVHVSRPAFEEACESRLQLIDALLADVLARAAASEGSIAVSVVEVIGGGSRMNAVKARILNAVAAASAASSAASIEAITELSYHLDGASAVADGAALYAAALCSPPFTNVATTFLLEPRAAEAAAQAQVPLMSPAELADASALEKSLSDADRESEERKELANKLESAVYSLREDILGVSAAQRPALESVLNAALEWHSESAETATVAELREKHDSMLSDLRAKSPELAKLLDDRESDRKKRALEAAEAAAAAAAEAKLKPHHRARPQTNAERLEKANKLKAQGVDLWKNADVTMAASKWIDALGALEGAFDLSPQLDAEFKACKLSLYLNVSMAYLKLCAAGKDADKPDQIVVNKALHNCNRALEIDGKNVKARFRRGQAQQYLKLWDEAAADFKAVLELEPENVDAKRELTRVQKVIDARAEREKQMYARMFS